MRTFLWIGLGMLIMFVILKVLANTGITKDTSQTTARLKALLVTQQFANLVRTNEARELVKTQEFREFTKSLAADQVIALSKSLVG